MAVTINIPSQVKTYANLAAFPASGSLKTIYIAEDTNKTYRWDGSTYVEISASAATGLTVGTTPISSGTNGRVLFQGTGNVLQQSGNLFWDDTNGRLGIGGTPTTTLDVIGSATSGFDAIKFKSQYSGVGYLGTDSSNAWISTASNGGGTAVNLNPDFMRLRVQGSEAIRIFGTTRNVGINTTTDAGFRLDVNGTARVKGTGTTSSTTAFTVQNSAGTNMLQLRDDNYQLFGGWLAMESSRYIYKANNATGILTVCNDSTVASFVNLYGSSHATLPNVIDFGTASTSRMRIFASGNVGINTTTDAGFRLDVNGTARVNTLTIGLGTGQIATNTVLGNLALNSNTTGIRNVAIGQGALGSNTTGSYNVSIGRNTLSINTTNSNNTAVGNDALANAQADGNTAIGSSALQSATGSNNTAVGFGSLDTNTTGERNTAIGQGTSSGNFSGSVILGRLATATANNQFVVGSSGVNAGSVTTEVNTSTQVWNVVINGVARKILLA
jgi:hypothetical protein